MYFSFFGDVRVPGQINPQLCEVARLARWARYDEEGRFVGAILSDHIPDSLKEQGKWHDLGQDGSVVATAFALGDQAILNVQCWPGEWQEIEVVCWPLEFEGPAAIAGVCCSPRYGLTR